MLKINCFVQVDYLSHSTGYELVDGLSTWEPLGLPVCLNIQTGSDTYQSHCQIGTEGALGKVAGTWSWSRCTVLLGLMMCANIGLLHLITVLCTELLGNYKIVPKFPKPYPFIYARELIISVHQFKYFRKEV
jgi:hypothetical protein